MKIIDKNIAEQTRKIVRKDGGGNVWVDIPETEGAEQVLTDEQILQLSELVIKIESYYGCPQDIEWAMDVKGEIFITQSRPITTLSNKADFLVVDDIATCLEKAYTREASVIVEEVWTNTLIAHRDEFSLRQYQNKPLVLHYMLDGVVEIWENKKWTEDLMSALCVSNNDNPALFKNNIEEYLKYLKTIEKYWQDKHARSAEELEGYVGLLEKSMPLFDWMYYTAVDENSPKELRYIALSLRDKDVYFDQSHSYVRDSLVFLYPELKGYEMCIARSEISTPPNISLLKERFKNSIFGGVDPCFVGSKEQYKEKYPEVRFVEEVADLDVENFSGQTGSSGHAKGIVKIIKRRNQMSDVEDGCILVSPMTTPDFLPVMKKAAAIVTDEGGITCHAAIMARELGVPCVIGTEKATETLKDGDLVEVDADNGVVKVLEKVSKSLDE